MFQSRKTKTKLHKSNMKTVFLFAVETWRSNKEIEGRIRTRGFESRRIKRIMGIRCQGRMNKEQEFQKLC